MTWRPSVRSSPAPSSWANTCSFISTCCCQSFLAIRNALPSSAEQPSQETAAASTVDRHTMIGRVLKVLVRQGQHVKEDRDVANRRVLNFERIDVGVGCLDGCAEVIEVTGREEQVAIALPGHRGEQIDFGVRFLELADQAILIILD